MIDVPIHLYFTCLVYDECGTYSYQARSLTDGFSCVPLQVSFVVQ